MHLGTRSLTLVIDGIARTADVSDCRIVSTPMEGVGLVWQNGLRSLRRYRLQGTAAQEMATGSLWDLVWGHSDEFVVVDVRPAGGEVASTTQPHFTGSVWVTEPDGVLVGGTADASPGARLTFDFDWLFQTRPTRMDGAW